MMQQLSVSGLSKSFGTKVLLDNAGFTLKTGEILGIFGSNGSGKSTLLKILFGTVKAPPFSLKINNQQISAKDVIPKQLIAYLPQEPFIPKQLKVRDVIPLYYKGDTQDKLFYAPGIQRLANSRVSQLSMGELRYFELLLIGNLNHPFLMLDEPFSMIEPLHKEKIKEFLVALQSVKGIIVTDHYYRDVLSVSTKNLLLKNGSLIEVATEQELAANGYIPS